MAHHRYKTHEELVNTPGVVVDTVSFGKGYADYRYRDQSVLVDIANNNILGRKVEVGKDQYFGDWFCVFVPDEVKAKTFSPEESDRIREMIRNGRVTSDGDGNHLTSDYLKSVSSPPEDVFTAKYRPTSRLDHYSDSYDGTKKVKSSASDEELRYKCIKEAQRFFQEGCHSPELLIKAAEKIYKFIKQ